MEDILYPSKIELIPGAHANEATLIAEPLFHGYGTTIGNTLRRVLLSSLPGAAVTAMRAKGAQHEFMAVPHVKEDVLQIILNLKQVRLKSFAEGPVKLRLHKKGEGPVTAGDIEPNAEVEIANPKLLIATITDKAGEVEIELTVERGRGYRPTEERGKEKMELGTIAIDALFSPVVSVGFRVEAVRVGEITNYDRIVMTIETDGTISPKEAVEESAKVLINHLNLFSSVSIGSGPAPGRTLEEPSALEGSAAEEKPKKSRKKKTEDHEA